MCSVAWNVGSIVTSYERFKRMFEYIETDKIPIVDDLWDERYAAWKAKVCLMALIWVIIYSVLFQLVQMEVMKWSFFWMQSLNIFSVLR